ncbi:rhodanese-like domain-containing protein [Thermodesulfobacteriota bacterium]
MLSPMAARMAAKMGYANVKVYHDGAPVWVKNGNTLLTTYDFVDKRMGYIVLIDARGPEEAKKGHIQGAVAISLKNIVKEKNQFPLDRKAYIVIYDNTTNLAGIGPVVKEITGWGYKNVFVLDNGYSGWTSRKGAIQKGSARTKIFYLPRPHPGEIVGDEFVNIVRTKPADTLILDVRTQSEASLGMIDGAVNIPVDELQARLNELPKDKELVAHCRSGLRAEMGYSILRNAGFKARFLNDKVAVIDNVMYCCFK